jgi:hypothetical protein
VTIFKTIYRYKWAVIMRTIHELQVSFALSTGLFCLEHRSLLPKPESELQENGRLPRANITSIDVGGGSAPLQYFMAERGDVINIDINFRSSWFSTDANGI